jgi:hypothetical protein
MAANKLSCHFQGSAPNFQPPSLSHTKYSATHLKFENPRSSPRASHRRSSRSATATPLHHRRPSSPQPPLSIAAATVHQLRSHHSRPFFSFSPSLSPSCHCQHSATGATFLKFVFASRSLQTDVPPFLFASSEQLATSH